MATPSPRALQAFDFIVERLHTTGVPPSGTEIAAHLGLRSKSVAVDLLAELEDYGYIRRLPSRWRAIEVLKHPAPHSVPDIGTLIVQAMRTPVPAEIIAATKTNLRPSSIEASVHCGRALGMGA